MLRITSMRKTDALRVFKSIRAIAQTLEISDSAVSQWGEIIPPMSAHELAKRSAGRLSYDPKMYRHFSPRKQRIAELLAASR